MQLEWLQLLEDFLRVHGYEWPATRAVQHVGTQSSYCVNLNAVEGYANMFQADQRKCWRDLNLTGTKPLADERV